MTFRQLIRRSLRFHARSHLGVLLGAAVAAAVLIGALAVGDSVRESLRERAEQRIGRAQLVMDTGDRLFPQGLVNRMSSRSSIVRNRDETTTYRWTGGETPGSSTVAIRLAATIARQDGGARANRIQLFGVSPGFWAFASDRNWGNRPGMGIIPTRSAADAVNALIREDLARVSRHEVPSLGEKIPTDGVWLNGRLAAQLGVKAGDAVVVRVAKPGALSQDAVISPRTGNSVALRLHVQGVVSAGDFGDVNLAADQGEPLNAFVQLDELATRLGQAGRANLYLAGSAKSTPEPGWRKWILGFENRFGKGRDWPMFRAFHFVEAEEAPSSITSAIVEGQLEGAWTLDDAELSVRVVEPPAPATGGEYIQPSVEVASRRIFLDPPVFEAAVKPRSQVLFRDTAPGDTAENVAFAQVVTNGVGVLTYFVNQLRVGDRATPYSMVTAAGPPLVPADLRDDEILINEWLADDLKTQPGDSVELTYYLAESGAHLVERTNSFRVRGIVPLRGVHADRTLMPEFPGLAKAESTEQWDAGFELVHKIRAKDEAYWKQWRGTPKAFVTLAAGQKMWANRFGNLTSIRFPIATNSLPDPVLTAVYRNLLANLHPADFGLHFEPVREQALRAASSGQDFGGLFLGFSFFLIIAALLLTALLFQFSLEQRATEIGTLLALGFEPARVRRLLLGEGFALSVIGTAIGAAGGIGYAKAVLWGLRTIWRDAVASAGLEFHCSPATLLGGAVASVLIAVVTIRVALRRQVKRPARELLAEGAVEQAARLEGGGARWPRWVAVGAAVAALGLVGSALATGRATDPGLFFGAGSLLLIAGLAATSTLLALLRRRHSAELTLSALGVRGATRRSRRSLATVALLACGSFLIVAVGANKLDALRDATRRGSGTGGFALWGESTLPVVHDLNTTKGRQFFGLDDQQLAGVSVVPMRVREGDDASCLNLNRAQRPRLLGVKPELLAQRGAFTFTKLADGLGVTNGWLALNSERGTRNAELPEVPAIGDANSIQWALGKKIGDTIDYVDERGQAFRVRLVGAVANSILQGSLLIDEAQFVKRFPGEAGYRAFLIDVPHGARATSLAASDGLGSPSLRPSPEERSSKSAASLGTGRQQEISGELSRALEDVGLELTPTVRRLAQFNAVQNTYLNTFQVLGGLGLLLGSVGLGVVVLRNVFERRGELAVLQAVGFERAGLHRLVLAEHGALLLVGLAVGVGAAVLAVLPALLSPGAGVPWRSMALTLAAVLVNGALWTWLATRRALGGRLLDALRAGG